MEKKERKLLIKWLLIGLFSGIAIAVIAAVCSTLINSTSSGRYVKETYCVDEYDTGEQSCDQYGSNCIPVTECLDWKTDYVPMGEHLKSALKLNLEIGIISGIIAGFLATAYILEKMKNKESLRKWEEERDKEKEEKN